MKIKVFILILLVQFLQANEKWTIGLSTVSSLENAETYINKSKYKYFLTTNKINNEKFHINYGIYKNYKEAKKALKKLNHRVAYVRKINTVKKWTIGLSTVSNIKNAKRYINNNFKKNYRELFINKTQGKRYQVNYGIYSSYKKAKNSLNKIYKKFNIKDGYIRKIIISKNYINKKIENSIYTENSIDTLQEDITKLTTQNENNIIKKQYTYLENENILETQVLHQTTNSLNQVNNKYNTLQKHLKLLNSQNENINYNKLSNEKEYSKDNIENTNSTSLNYGEITFVNPQNKYKSYEKNYKTKLDNDNSKFGIELKYSPIKLSSDLKFGNSGSKIDLKNDLGINKVSNTFITQIVYKNNNHKGFINYSSLKYRGSSTINKNLTANDYTYLSGQTLNSNIKNSILNTGYRYNIYDFDLGFDFYNFKQDIAFNNSSNTTSINLDYNILALGTDKQHTIKNYLFSYGLKYGIGNNINLLDYYLSTGIKDFYIKDSSISVGYESKTFDISHSIYNGQSKYDGLFINFNKEF